MQMVGLLISYMPFMLMWLMTGLVSLYCPWSPIVWDFPLQRCARLIAYEFDMSVFRGHTGTDGWLAAQVLSRWYLIF